MNPNPYEPPAEIIEAELVQQPARSPPWYYADPVLWAFGLPAVLVIGYVVVLGLLGERLF